jgi:preprotein translocase subunit SecD
MKITFKIWIMIAFILFALISIFSIPPQFMEKGVLVRSIDKNSSIFNEGLRTGDIIIKVNNQEINNIEDYSNAIAKFKESFLIENTTQKLVLLTKKSQIASLFYESDLDGVIVDKLSKTRIKTGLDIQGGARALVTSEGHKLSDAELDDLISISQERLNVYGLTDLNIRKASDLSGNRFMIVEIAGTSPSDLENLVAQQGKFEAKIGNETIFNGGNKDVTYVGRSGQDAGIYDCFAIQDGEACNFRFTIYLSEEAAKRQADATSNLSMNISSGGKYLSKPLDLYLDKNLLDSLNIGADLKGKIATQIQISGSGSGKTRQEAIDATKANMKKLQTILITGSLPFKLEIVKTDRISPVLGDKFTKTIFIASLLAVLSVFLIVLLRYRRIKISAAIVFMMLSEILITLGIAALIRWNIDLASIAGIIAAIGTGVNDQIVIVDESRRNKQDSLKQRIKNALFIIFTAYATAVVSLLPLYWAGAGLLKGFAFTSLLGITAGVFITRPAFADIARQLEEKEE